MSSIELVNRLLGLLLLTLLQLLCLDVRFSLAFDDFICLLLDIDEVCCCHELIFAYFDKVLTRAGCGCV